MSVKEMLKLSPTPWCAASNDERSVSWVVYDAEGDSITFPYLMRSDACIVAAAPQLLDVVLRFIALSEEATVSTENFLARLHETLQDAKLAVRKAEGR